MLGGKVAMRVVMRCNEMQMQSDERYRTRRYDEAGAHGISADNGKAGGV
jgi:hypothetical protein